MSRLLRCAVFVALFVLLAGLRVSSHFPALPSPLRIDLTLERGEPGRADPLIVAGRPIFGDLLTVKFLDERTLQFIYDSWGFPGISSQPVAITAGETLRLAIEMPALTQFHGSLASTDGRVRVRCNDQIVLSATAHFYVREPERIFFGVNPIGGTVCGPTLRGKTTTPEGRTLLGGPEQRYSWRERLLDWVENYPLQVAVLILFSAAVGFWGGRRAGTLGFVARSAIDLAARHRWFVGSSAVATVLFTWIVTMGSFQFSYREVFGFFYDYQAATLLHGRLDVPEDAIGGEGFEAHGKLYGYFGPTPALLRIPFVLAGFAFGTTARVFMVAYFVACLLASNLIVRHALKLTRSAPATDAATEPLSPFAVLCVVGSVGLGSTIFFLGSRSFMYHEAILAGVTFALWSCWCSLQHLQHPKARWWIGALVCGVLSIHARPPTGLFALTVLGCVSAILAARAWRSRDEREPGSLRRALVIGAASALGVLSLNGIAWLKFRTIDPAPLRFSRAMMDPGRLERIEGKSVHLANLPYNFDTYFLRPNFRIEPGFPWLYLISHQPRRSFPKAKIDLPDHTLAVPYAMPSLFVLATLGCAGAALGFPRARVPIGVVWIAALPMSLALLAAVATAQRYTGDFVPFLICAAAFGLAAVESARAGWRTLLRVLTGLATVGAMAVTIAITLHYQGDTLWGVPEETRSRYQHLRRTIDAAFGHESVPNAKK